MAQIKNLSRYCARTIVLMTILSCVSVPLTAQFTNGATKASCEILEDPNIPPQPAGTSPYTIVTSPNRYTPGEVMDVILLASPRGITFEGALLQARAVGEDITPIGIFGIPSFRLANFFDCGGSPNGTVTNNNNVTKTPPITFTWTPPGNQVGDIVIHFVVEQTPGIYWIESLVVSSVPLPFCSSAPCYNEATCVEEEEGFTCLCRLNFIGTVCEIQIVEHNTIEDSVFDLEDYSSGGYSSYVFVNVPTDAILDIYGPGERVDVFQIGHGSEIGVNAFIPGEQGLPHTRITGNTFWIEVSINDVNERPPELRIVMYHVYIPAPELPITRPELPADLLNLDDTIYMIQRLPEGDSIVSISGVDPASVRLGVGRVFGENEAKFGQKSVRTTLYDPFAWFILIGPVREFQDEITLCPVDPCAEEPCSLGYCEPGPKNCLDYTCHKVTATACAACTNQPCLHNGVCEYDTVRRRSFTCICPRPWTGRRCENWRFRDIAPGEIFDMQLPSFPLFLPFYRNFYTLFTVTADNRQVRILDVEGFVYHFGLGPAIKHHDIDQSLLEFDLDETNQFWIVLSPNGLTQRLLLRIV